MSKERLEQFFDATRAFSADFTRAKHNQLRGVTDGKAVGTYIEHKFEDYLVKRGVVQQEDIGSSAKGIDLPSLNIDIKVTSIRQPQSSAPFKSFEQKIEGLGYSIVLFVYEKTDTEKDCFLPLRAVRFIPKERTGDFITTKAIRDIIDNGGDEQDILGYLIERMGTIDETILAQYAEKLLKNPPLQGYLTVTNAPQWRLGYKKVVTKELEGVVKLDPPDAGQIPSKAIKAKIIVDPLVEE